MDVRLPDGTILRGIPDGTSRATIVSKLQANGRQVPDSWLTRSAAKPSLGSEVLGAAKDLGSAIARPIAKAVTGPQLMVEDAATQAYDIGGNVVNRLRGKPATPNHQLPSEAFEQSLDKVTRKPTNMVGQLAEDASTMVAGGRGGGALARDVGLLPRAALSTEEAARLSARVAAKAPDNAKITAARRWGFKVLPSEGGGPTGKVLQGIGGKAQSEYALSRDNAEQVDRLAARAIGLNPSQAITPANIERLKNAAYSVYHRVATVGRIPRDEAFKADLEKVTERSEQAKLDYPEDFNESVEKEIKKFNKPSADAASMLEKIKDLRARAGRNMASTDNDTFELGLAQKKIATAMEDRIARHVADNDPELIAQFRAARTNLAKIYNVEEALSPSGHVSAAVLARQLNRKVPLSDELKAIAQAYKESPKTMRHPDSLTGTNTPFSALDYLVGGAAALTHPAAALKIAGGVGARAGARAIIRSKAYQRAAIKARIPTKTRGTTLADLVIGSTGVAPADRQ